MCQLKNLILLVLIFCNLKTLSQTITSQQSGFWDDPSTWVGGVVPSASNSVQIIIQSGNTVRIRDIQIADQLTVSAGGMLHVVSSGTLQISNGPGDDDLIISGSTDVDGIVERSDGSSMISSMASLRFHAGSVYRHRYTSSEGELPLALWHSQSTIEILGYTSASGATDAGNWTQDFGSFVWNTPGQTVAFDLHGKLNHVHGNFTVASTGSSHLLLSSLAGDDELIVDGDLSVIGNGSLELTNSPDGNFTVKVTGNVSINTSGGLNMALNGIGSVNVGGNLLMDSGIVSETGNGTGEFIFDTGRGHFFRRGPTGVEGNFSGRVNYRIGISDTLDLASTVVPAGVGNSNSNTFMLAGTVMIGSVDTGGALQNNTTGGNIRTTVSSRIFSAGSRIIYNGQLPQFIGNSGAAAGPEKTTIIDNASGVNLASNVILEGALVLKNGSLNIPDSRSLTLSGGLSSIDGAITGTSTSTLVIADSVFNSLDLFLNPLPLELGTLSINRRAPGSSVTIHTPLILNQLNLMSGDLVNTGFVRIKDNGMITRWQHGRLLGQRITSERYNVTYRTTSLSGGPYAKFSTGLELPVDPILNVLNIITGQSMDTVQLAQDIIIHTLLDMNRGRFYADDHTIEFKGNIWSDDVGNFGYGKSLVIFSDSTTVQGSSNSVFNSIRVTPGATLHFARNTTVFGDVDFQPGSIVHAENITFGFSGSNPQLISPDNLTVGNITVTKSNQSFVQLLGPLNLRGLLRFNSPSANIDFRSNGFLTLLSATDTASVLGTGMIYRLQNGNTVSGDVHIQRYLRGEGRIYRYLSSPVANATVSSWKDDFAITGNFNDPSNPGTICGSLVNSKSSSFFFFEESAASGTHSGYVAYPLPGDLSSGSPLEPGRGYAAFIRECTAPTLIDVSGSVNQQPMNLPVTYTPGSSQLGWNLVGNPYPCTIDWDVTTQGWIKTNISSTIAIRDNGGGGFFRYWDGDGIPSDIPEGRIAPGQAFWIRATAPNPLLTIREGVKVIQEAEIFREENDSIPAIVLSLSHRSFTDQAYVKVKKGALSVADNFDCPKLDNESFDLGTLSDNGELLAINALGGISCEGILKLVVKDADPGTYHLTLETRGEFEDFEFTLHDKFFQKQEPMNDQGYEFEITQDENSRASDRFSVAWRPRVLPDIRAIPEMYSLCDDDSVEVMLTEFDPDASYEILENNRLISSSLMLRSSDLEAGRHVMRIMIKKNCAPVSIENEIIVIRDSPSVSEITDGAVCREGEIHLKAKPLQPLDQILWYDSRTSLSPVYVDSLFRTPVLTNSAIYFVSSKSVTGCESQRIPVKAEVIAYDPVKIFRVGDDVLKSSYSGDNTWYYNGEEIRGETDQYIQTDRSGRYGVAHSFRSCRSQDEYDMQLEEEGITLIYPNPVNKRLTIESDFNLIERVELINTMGVVVLRFDENLQENQKKGIFEVSEVGAGFYFLKIVRRDKKERILGLVKH